MSTTRTISEVLASNVSELREDRGLSLRELARRTNELGHSIDASGLMRLEKGERRATVDDLLSVAAALDVSPFALMLPSNVDEPVRFGDVELATRTVAQWMLGKGPLRKPRPVLDLSQTGGDDVSLSELARQLESGEGDPEKIREALQSLRPLIDQLEKIQAEEE